MGDCIYCGQPAGFLRRAHGHCKDSHERGKSRIVGLVSRVSSEDVDYHRLSADIKEIASSSYMQRDTIRTCIVAGYENAVERALDDHVITEEEQDRLNGLQKHLSLSQDALNRNGAFDRLIKAGVLRDVLNGVVPQGIQFAGVPFNLQKSETLVWVFQDVDYYEVKTKTKFVGGSRGVSLRVTKGVYYRVGGFKGERVQESATVHVDTGLMGLTTKHIYFAGSSKRFRINYRKIVAFESFSDGIGVQRDAQTAKPQSFRTGDGWFTYNLAANLAQI